MYMYNNWNKTQDLVHYRNVSNYNDGTKKTENFC